MPHVSGSSEATKRLSILSSVCLQMRRKCVDADVIGDMLTRLGACRTEDDLRAHLLVADKISGVEHDGVVYVLHAVGTSFYKIGYTAGTAEKRRDALQTGCPYDLVVIADIPGSEDDEKKAHRRLSSRRIRGEWFDLTLRDLQSIGVNAAGTVDCQEPHKPCPVAPSQRLPGPRPTAADIRRARKLLTRARRRVA